MSEFMKLKSPAVEGVSSGAGRLSETSVMFHSRSSASNQPAPSPIRSSDGTPASVGAGSASPVTAGGSVLSRDVAQPADNVTIVSDRNRRGGAGRIGLLRADDRIA